MKFFIYYLFVYMHLSNVSCLHLLQPINEMFIGVFRNARNTYLSLVGRTSEDMSNLITARQLNKIQDVVPPYVPFPCDVTHSRSKVRPHSVNKLRPGDIDVIASIGDSLTAGFGLLSTSVVNLLVENRGLSWSGGGQGTWREYLTIPNILKEFNPNLIGYAYRDSYTDRYAWFNSAASSSTSDDLRLQVNNLVKRILSDPQVDIHNDWKLITIKVGTNDVCSWACDFDNPEDILEIYETNLLYILRVLRNNLPRTMVNFVPVQNLRPLIYMRNIPKRCQLLLQFLCPCFFTSSATNLQKLDRLFYVNDKLQELAEKLSNLDEFHKHDFTVTYQPFTLGYNIPSIKNGTDYSYLAHDCFHFSQKTGAEFANGLWNNMLEPVQFKSKTYDRLFDRFMCPSEEYPYIFTQKNSEMYQASYKWTVSKKTDLNKCFYYPCNMDTTPLHDVGNEEYIF